MKHDTPDFAAAMRDQLGGVGPRSASYPRAATAAPQQPQLNKPAAGYPPKQQSYRGPGRSR